jgi:hypothetical protein
MNGHARDDLGTDLDAGRPTLSPSIDPLLRRVLALQIGGERDNLLAEIWDQVAVSPSLHAWIRAPDRYFSEFEPQIVTGIELRLRQLLEELRERARERGWELDPGESPGDIHQR